MYRKVLSNTVFRWSKTAMLAVGHACAGYTLLEFAGTPVLLKDRSMDPTFTDGQVVLCRKWPWCGDVCVGDVVLCRHPGDPTRLICKRVAAEAGELVDADRHKNDSLSRRPVFVPPGHVWLRGDNADASVDPGEPVPIGLIRGKVVLRLFPALAGAHTWKVERSNFDRGRRVV